MAGKRQQAIFSFSSGVMSPRLSARADSPKHREALLTGENFIITPQGGAVFRQGLEHIKITSENRIFQFHQGGNESDIIVEILPTTTYQAGQIAFYTDSSIDPIATITGHSYTSEQLDALYFTNQEHYGVITHESHPPLILEYKRDGTFTATYLPSASISNFEFRDANSPAASETTDIDYTLSFTNGDVKNWREGRGWNFKYNEVFAAKGDGSPKDYEYTTNTADMELRLENALSRIPELQGAGTTYSATHTGGTPSANPGDVVAIYVINITGENSGRVMEVTPANAEADRYVTITNSVDEEDIVEPAWSFPTVVLSGSNYYQCIKTHTSAVANQPPNTEFWTDLGTTKPDEYDWQYPDGNLWVIEQNYSPEGRGFPRVCVFHEQRLIMASSPEAPTSIWGSRIGAYQDFRLGVEANDPFSFTLDTSDSPTIKWMSSQLELILGTSGGDWTIGAEVTLGPGDIQAQKQNYARSHSTPPVIVNTDIFYIEQGQNKLRMTKYQRQQLGFASQDVSLVAEHLFHEGIKRIVVLRTPEVLIVMLKNDGTLTAMTYGEDIGAYVEIKAAGFYQDIAAYYSTVTNQDELWVTVSHGYSEELPNTYYLEKMPYPSRTMTPRIQDIDPSLTQQGVVFLDSWIAGFCINNVISGLEHLEGFEVGALVDDAFTGVYTVNDGAIVLEDAGVTNTEPYNGSSVVGFIYQGTLKTFEFAPTDQYGQTALGTTRRWNKLYIRLLDSALPKVNGKLPADRTPPTEMDIAEILRMGIRDYEATQLGQGDASILITQDRPYPTHVIALYGEYFSES
jgi:hypothetical protein